MNIRVGWPCGFTKRLPAPLMLALLMALNSCVDNRGGEDPADTPDVDASIADLVGDEGIGQDPGDAARDIATDPEDASGDHDMGQEDIAQDLAPADADQDAALTDAALTDSGTDLPTDPGTDYGPITVPDELGATGFYRTHRAEDGRWWLVTPDGLPFYSVGVCSCQPNGSEDRTTGQRLYRESVLARHGNDAAWATATADRLESWGFNTVGAWSDIGLLGSRLAYTPIIYITGSDWLQGNIPDYFAPAFEERCRQVAETQVRPRKDDPNLLGWFLDNELRWGPDWRSQKTLLYDYLAMPEDAPGRIEAEKWRGDPQGFLRVLADRYFQVTTTAIRNEDPNHMILGIRSVSVLTPQEVVAAAGPWLDVFSANNYVFIEGLPDALNEAFGPLIDAGNFLERFAQVSGLPVMVTEFSFRALDSGLPNTFPPIYPVLYTQQERADGFEDYVREAYRRPWIVGHHWFEWGDQPAGGRFDGEDNNFGLVNVNDDPWQVLVDRMTAIHAQAPHRQQALSESR